MSINYSHQVADYLRLHTPAEAAEILRCSESWVKEQARRRQIPFTMVGGQYRFTDAHLKEVINIFEERPGLEPVHTPRQSRTAALPDAVTPLKARPPKRSRQAAHS